MDAKQLIGFLAEAEGLRTEASIIINTILSFGPEAKRLIEPMTDGTVDLKARAFKRYTTVHGFSREEALALVMSDFEAVKKAASSKK